MAVVAYFLAIPCIILVFTFCVQGFWFPPALQLDQMNFIVREAQNVTLRCFAEISSFPAEDFNLYQGFPGSGVVNIIPGSANMTYTTSYDRYSVESNLEYHVHHGPVLTINTVAVLDSGYYGCSMVQSYGTARLWFGTSSVSYLHVATDTDHDDVYCFVGSGRYGVLQSGKDIELSCNCNLDYLNVTFQTAGEVRFSQELIAEGNRFYSSNFSWFRIRNVTSDVFNGTSVSCHGVDGFADMKDRNNLCRNIPTLIVLESIGVQLTPTMIELRDGDSVTLTCASDPAILSDIVFDLRETEGNLTGNFSVSQSIGRSELKIDDIQFSNTSEQRMKISCMITVPLPPNLRDVPYLRESVEATIYQFTSHEVEMIAKSTITPTWLVISSSLAGGILLAFFAFICLLICRRRRRRQCEARNAEQTQAQSYDTPEPSTDQQVNDPSAGYYSVGDLPTRDTNVYMYASPTDKKLTSMDYRRTDPGYQNQRVVDQWF